ncbi:mCG144538, partial [Mus musculus]
VKNRDQSGESLPNPEKKGQPETTQDRESGGGRDSIRSAALSPIPHCTAEKAGQEGRRLWSNRNWSFHLCSFPSVIFKSLQLLIQPPVGAAIIFPSPFNMNPLGLEVKMTRMPYENLCHGIDD